MKKTNSQPVAIVAFTAAFIAVAAFGSTGTTTLFTNEAFAQYSGGSSSNGGTSATRGTRGTALATADSAATVSATTETAVSVPGSLYGENVLRLNDHNSAVVLLQENLRATGHFTFHTSTGCFGPITERAVKAFQADNGLPVTGVYDAATLAAVHAQVPQQNAVVEATVVLGSMQTGLSEQTMSAGDVRTILTDLQTVIGRLFSMLS